MNRNQIYDLDEKVYFNSDSSTASAPSTMPTVTTNYGVNMLPILNFPKYQTKADGISMTYSSLPSQRDHMSCSTRNSMDIDYSSQLVVLEQPTEKFRFRYKSEMHGTHGSLNGERSERNKKTFPEVELKNFNSAGVIRCSLFQTNIDKPSLHSHQLVVHKDDMDVCDPHDVYVSPEKGYIARFENMGIIHTAKKDISKELLKKKREKLKFELQCEQLPQKQEKALKDEAEREAKSMNLNQVRLCFEAFKIVNGGRWIKICEPVFSRPINNRKSALTGELKICRLSIIAGSAAGGDDLILLVEKVNKNNIKVRFYEVVNDEEVWEAFGYFTEADVHHQYAIVVRTPPYRDKDIDNHVNVFIELVRESDNERSLPVTFRYKPRDIVMSRKRRRTNTSSSTISPLNSYELPESIAHGLPQQVQLLKQEPQTISQEFNKEAELKALCGTDTIEYQCQFMQQVEHDSDELQNIISGSLLLGPEFGMLDFELDVDGEVSPNVRRKRNASKKHFSNAEQNMKVQKYHPTIKLLISAFNDHSKLGLEKVKNKVKRIFDDYFADNDNGESIVHEIVKQGSQSDAIIVFKILSKLNLTDLLSHTNNLRQTPLHVACIFDQPVFIRPLLGLKCDPNVQDSNGNTALHIAVSENLKHCIESFVSHLSSSKLNVNLTNYIGLTPLHLAIRKNNVDFVKILLVKCNASAKIANSSDGNNALHLAVQQHNKEIIKLVLENCNAKLNTKNQAGHNPVDLAKTLVGEERTEILNLLHAFLPSDVSSPTIDFIKEEPEFDDSSSSTGDDDDKSSQMSLEIKEENEEFYLKQLLKDEKICQQLGKLLNVDDKWKKLGSQLKLDHLLVMFVNAEAMLRYVVGLDDIKALNLLNALQTVDKEAAGIVTSFLRS